MEINIRNINSILKSLDRKFYIQLFCLSLGSIFLIKNIIYKPYLKKKLDLDSLKRKYVLVEGFLDNKSVSSGKNKMLFKNIDVGEILPYINTFLEANKIKILSLVSGEIKNILGIKSRTFLIKFETRFNKILMLLSKLELSKMSLLVEEITIKKKKINIEEIKEEFLNNPLLEVKLMLRAYAGNSNQ